MTAFEKLALSLWARARAAEKRGDECSLAGITDGAERSRLMSKATSCYGQAHAFEQSAWMALSAGANDQPVAADFFSCVTVE